MRCPACGHSWSTPEQFEKRSKRHQEIWERFVKGESQGELAEALGVTKQAINLSLNNHPGYGALKWERRQARLSRAIYERLMQRLPKVDKTCRVCGAWIIRDRGNATTCSKPCARAWAIARYHIDPEEAERHRYVQAQAVLRHPERYPSSNLDWAKRVLSGDPPPPNRTWRVSDSKAARAVDAARRGLMPE